MRVRRGGRGMEGGVWRLRRRGRGVEGGSGALRASSQRKGRAVPTPRMVASAMVPGPALVIITSAQAM